ncbi:MAG: class I SAM-dependent methyltransferase [Nitrososphaerales archaeon]
MDIDWAETWKRYMQGLNRVKDVSFWDSRAARDNGNWKILSELTKKQLERIDVDFGCKVLEIGSGTGRLTIPLAKVAERVTVIEPSKEMLKLLKVNLKKHGLDNVSFICKRWEDVEIGADIDRHDIVIASLSLLMIDIRDALLKMDAAAKSFVYLFVPAESWMPFELQRIVFDNKAPFNLSDHIIIYNLLDGMGIKANISIINYKVEQGFNNLEELRSELMNMYNIPESKEEELENYINQHVDSKDDSVYYIRNKKVATIWWEKT